MSAENSLLFSLLPGNFAIQNEAGWDDVTSWAHIAVGRETTRSLNLKQRFPRIGHSCGVSTEAEDQSDYGAAATELPSRAGRDRAVARRCG